VLQGAKGHSSRLAIRRMVDSIVHHYGLKLKRVDAV
jgi:hypothetical protein